MPRKVLMLLSNGYRPDPRVQKEALALKSAGYEVTILAWDRDNDLPHSEVQKAIDIKRIRTGRVSTPMSFVSDYPSFLFKAVALARDMHFDVVHSHDFDTLFLGIMLSRLRGVPLVYDAHEVYARMIRTDVPGSVASVTDRLESFLVRNASLVVTANEFVAEHLHPNYRSDIVVVMNCIDLPEDVMRPQRKGREVVLFYGGTLEPMRYIQETIEAVEDIEDCRVRIAGLGRLKEKVVRAANETDKVEYLGFLPHDVLLSEMSKSDIVLCLLDPANENYEIATPNRLCEAMALGIPVLASTGTLAGRIVSDTGCGITMDWSRENLRAAVDKIRDPEYAYSLGEKGRASARISYNWSTMRERLIDGYGRLWR